MVKQVGYGDKEPGQVAYEARFSRYRPHTERWEDQPEEVRAIWRSVEREVAKAETRRREAEVAKLLPQIKMWTGYRVTPAGLAQTLRDYQHIHPVRGRLDWAMLAAAKFIEAISMNAESVADLAPPAEEPAQDEAAA